MRLRLLLAVAVLTIAGAVWGVSQIQRGVADETFAENLAGAQMLTAMLDQETGLRGFVLAREEEFLEPFVDGQQDFDAALERARQNGEPDERQALNEQVAAARRWQELARDKIARVRRQEGQTTVPELRDRKRAFDRFRVLNTRYREGERAERRSELDRAGVISVATIIAVGILFGGVGYLAIERQAAGERRRRARGRAYRISQAEFYVTMQIMRDEDEAYSLVKQHLERSIPDAGVVVLSRNNSANRLTAATPLPEGSPLAAALVNAQPESCLAVRLAREYRRGEDADPLLGCGIAGRRRARSHVCRQLVGGEVIGSVLVEHAKGLGPSSATECRDSVAQAAPVLANLRNLAIAETRAVTDALTGLPNQRACHDTLKRMVAHASRTVSPLAAVLLDLDHFKQINDLYGHGAGDEVLAAVGAALTGGLRASDFAGRYGGEEFLVLLPDTDAEGALEAAEKVRAAIAQIEMPAARPADHREPRRGRLPDHALDSETLVRRPTARSTPPRPPAATGLS